jgi:DNA/RNA-binding domain of Phe-tRNA-synthetase-like protein
VRFVISDRVFEILPGVCFGVVVARGIDNRGSRPEINEFLRQSLEAVQDKFRETKPKDHPAIQPYREAFQKLGFNPNKFASSVEALITRVAKGGVLPDINPAVNLVNACSLKYILPMGAHDLDAARGDIEVRFSRAGDSFIPFGENEPEILEEGELIYADAAAVKTRRWIWRQSDRGKVTAESRNIFFPIDGFAGHNRTAVLAARDALAAALERIFACRVQSFYLDAAERSRTLLS